MDVFLDSVLEEIEKEFVNIFPLLNINYGILISIHVSKNVYLNIGNCCIVSLGQYISHSFPPFVVYLSDEQ